MPSHDLLLVLVSLTLALLALVLSVYLLASRARERRLARLDLNLQVLAELSSVFYSKWKTDDCNVKAYKHALSLLGTKDAHTSRVVKVARRARKIESLETKENNFWKDLSSVWISSVGAFAREASKSRVALRTYLQTNHLAIIREGMILEPVLVWHWAQGSYKEEEKRTIAWGIALFLLAINYHIYSPVQRAVVYIDFENSDEKRDKVRVPVLDSGAPKWMRRQPKGMQQWLLCCIDSCRPWYRLRKRHFNRAWQELEEIASTVTRQVVGPY